MCLFPKFIRNPKYKPNKKNKGYPPICTEDRKETLYVPIGCGNCIECRKQKAREWQIRLANEIKNKTKAYFVTLTFSEEALNNINTKLNHSEANASAGYAIRMFLERWRKHYKKSLRHWLITELGHNSTERIHIHGLIFTDEIFNNEILSKYWQYGRTDIGQYVNQRTINYIVKYVTKIDNDHKGYKAEIFASAGIGNNWLKTYAFEQRKGSEIEYMTLPNGQKTAIPIYYRNKIWNEKEREDLWIKRVREGKIYVMGIECNMTTERGQQAYNNLLLAKQRENKLLGYGDDSDIWNKKEYNTTLRKLNITKSTKNNKNIT